MNYMIVLYLSFILCGGMITNVNNLYAKANTQQREGYINSNNGTYEQQQAAQKSLEILKALPLSILKELGFETEQMIERCLLGKPISAYIIGLEIIKKSKKDNTYDPEIILTDAYEIHYPVYVDEMPVSSITIRKREGEEWAFAQIGGKEILFAEQARMKHFSSTSMPLPSYFMVQIQSIYLTFLGYYSNGKMYLILTHEHPDLKIPLYEPVPAKEIFIELKDNI